MADNYEWDEDKAQENLRKHGIGFKEAETVFDDQYSVTIDDADHSFEEERYIDIGYSTKGQLLVVVYTERGSATRIISCRRATAWERRIYEQDDS